jgi:hypothetical protein
MTISLLAKLDHTILINKKVITYIPRHHFWGHHCMVDCHMVPQGGAFSKPIPAKWWFEMCHQAGMAHFLLGREAYALYKPTYKYRLAVETHNTRKVTGFVKEIQRGWSL